MPAAKRVIPLHKLRESTDQGFQIKWVNMNHHMKQEAVVLGAHRDDHYIFLFQKVGVSHVMVDFKQFSLGADQLFYVLPGQVHHYVLTENTTEGWFVALDAGLIPGMLRTVLEDPLSLKSPIHPGEMERRELLQCLELIYTVNRRQTDSTYHKQTIYALLTSFVAMVTAIYANRRTASIENVPRPMLITQQFRKLLARDYKTMKSPAEYAAACNLSLSYLNEVVKTVTGAAVSYWIQQEVVLEAKRLLYHSEFSIKEIAYELGYEDHAYFCRLFKKTVGETPGEFRKHYRE
jgi:AraC family transcriptional regulator, transcriptional activator of pobA